MWIQHDKNLALFTSPFPSFRCFSPPRHASAPRWEPPVSSTVSGSSSLHTWSAQHRAAWWNSRRWPTRAADRNWSPSYCKFSREHDDPSTRTIEVTQILWLKTTGQKKKMKLKHSSLDMPKGSTAPGFWANPFGEIGTNRKNKWSVVQKPLSSPKLVVGCAFLALLSQFVSLHFWGWRQVVTGAGPCLN